MRVGRGVGFVLALACGVTLGSNARADAVAARLVYARPPDLSQCPGPAELERAVARRLGYSPFFPWATRTIVAEIRAQGATLHARAELVDDGGVVLGSRELSGQVAQCDELIASLALAISITLDPMSAVGGSAAEPESAKEHQTPVGEPEREPATAPTPATPAPTTLHPPARDAVDQRGSPGTETRTSMNADFALFANVGALPHAVPGLSAGLHLDRGVFLLGVEASALLPASRSAGEPGPGAVEISLLAGSVFPCGRIGAFALCALGSLGRMHGKGSGVASPREDSHTYAAAGARAMAKLSVSESLAMVGYLDANKTLTLPVFQLDGVDVWQPAGFAASAGVALSANFF